MQFRFGGPSVPMTIRLCRSLVWTQAMLVVFAGLFVILAALVVGEGNSIPFGSGSLTGSSAALLGGVYVLGGVMLVGLGVALGRRASWSRRVIVGFQVLLAGLLLVRSLDLSLSTVINVGLELAIIALLFAPASSAALRSRGDRAGAEAGTAAAPGAIRRA